jgi:hypothetical protein
MALQNNMTEQSPWIKALLASNLSQPEQAQGGGDGAIPPTTPPGGGYASTAPNPTPQQPQLNRIEDERSAGTRGTTPQSGTTDPKYAGANYHAQDPARLPLEQQITGDRTELARLNAPSKPPSWRQALVGSAIGGLAGYTHQLPELLTLRDRAAQRGFEEKQNLSNRIEQSTRQLSQESMQEEGQNLRARMAAQAQVASAERLGQTLNARTELGREQIQGRQNVTDTRTQSQEGIAAANRGQRGMFEQDKLSMFKQTQDYQRWKAQLDNTTKLHVASLQQGKAPAALMQTAVFANGGIKSLNDAEAAMQELEKSGIMGQSWAQNKVEDWIFGKGAVDPSVPPQIRQTIGKLRTALNLTASAMTRAHTQRGSKEVYDDLKHLLGPGQDWQALRGAMGESRDMLTQYVQAASDSNISNIRGGGATPPTAPPPQGNTITLDQFLKEPH